MLKLLFAFDRASVRSYDADGRMHVQRTPITKEQIAPYYGREIPNYEELGLDPNKVYRLYRSAEELTKAAHTFNRLPLLSEHRPTNAENPETEVIVGMIGENAFFEAPYLWNSMTVWSGSAIELIESEKKKEISSGYRYTVVMQPGVFAGEPFDGRMVGLCGNHVSMVESGRAGADVMVYDANPFIQPEPIQMAKKLTAMAHLVLGALAAHMAPTMAHDAKPFDFSSVVKDVTAKDFEKQIPKIQAAVLKLAHDAKPDELKSVLESLKPAAIAMDEAEKDDEKKQAEDEDDEDDEAKKKKQAEDEDTPPRAPEAQRSKEAKTAMDKQAMDKALATQRQQIEGGLADRYQASIDVKPLIGEVNPLAKPDAASIYKMALDAAGVPTEGIGPSSFKGMVAVLKVRPAASPAASRSVPGMAADAKTVTAFKGLDRIKLV